MGQKIDFVYLIATMPGRHSGDQVHKVKKTAAPSFFIFYVQMVMWALFNSPMVMYALFTVPPLFCAMGEKVDFVYLIATMPGRHSGDQVCKVKKTAAPLFFTFYCFRPARAAWRVHGRDKVLLQGTRHASPGPPPT